MTFPINVDPAVKILIISFCFFLAIRLIIRTYFREKRQHLLQMLKLETKSHQPDSEPEPEPESDHYKK